MRCSRNRQHRSSRAPWHNSPMHPPSPAIGPRRTRFGLYTSGARTQSWLVMPDPAGSLAYTIEPLAGEADLDGVLRVEAESFTNPWTREMYTWELQNRSVCHIYVVRTAGAPVVAFCAFWLVFDEIHINNVAVLPQFRAHGIGTALLQYVLIEARRLGATRATLEVRASNTAALRLYERLGFYVAATRKHYYSNPVEDALILWRDDSHVTQ
jgi:ribosomal-protein-alanine N-acetyltransferase